MQHQNLDNAQAGVRMGTVPFFTPTLLPKITSISHAFLAKWKVKRREYEIELCARCRMSGEDYDAVLTPISVSFDADLLNTFCDMKFYQESANVKEGMLIAEIDHIAGSVKNSTLPDIKALFKSKLRFNMTEDDVDARVLDYFSTFGQAMRSNGLIECFEGEVRKREKCKHLIASLHPPTLKAEVKQCVRFTHKTAATDARMLFTLIVEKATEHERQFQRLKTTKHDQPGRDTSTPKKDKKKPQQSKAVQPATKDTSETAVSAKTPTTAGKKPSAKRQPPSPCPKCKEMHWLRECPKITTDEEREQLRQQLRDQSKAKRARLKHLGELLPVPGREVTVNGILQLPYCPDSGSECTVICRAHWELLKVKCPGVQSEELANPVKN
ncbi:hypothetical protein PHMEG_00015337 [Phytophthora megakarya]|uniref:Uncharacterized protein n=1 Tax=Phytophthora megakarya TaxID=4795 RepID=A0A225W352_9STRA|nr:hypothetical protein PHMEG_00015337 [Phytophthora megakarya]